MARDFSKSTANYMGVGAHGIGDLINGAAAMSCAAFIQPDTSGIATGGSDTFASSINGNLTGMVLQGGASANTYRMGGRSQQADAFQNRDTTGTITQDGTTWTHVGGVMNFTGDTITPYLNGVADNGGSVTFGSNTFTVGTPTNVDGVGSFTAPPAATPQQMDGRIAELAIWNEDIGADNYVRLKWRRSPLRVMRANLKFYMPLYGNTSPEVDIISGINGTITGTVAAATHIVPANVDQIVGL